MDVNPRYNNLGETSRTSLVLDNPSLHASLPTCALCNKALSSDDELGDTEPITLCGDCKFLLLEDIEIASPDVYRRTRPLSRRRYNSSESTESVFSQQFSRIISQARLNPSINLDSDFQSLDGDSIVARPVRRASSLTTSNGSRRWHRVFSDGESDGVDSVYGESESNISSRRYRHFSGGETDTFSYVEDSDDGQSSLEIDNFGASDVDSDTDIDPMNAGIYHWNSDDQEEDDDYSSDGEIAEIEASTGDSYIGRAHNRGFPRSNRPSNEHANMPRGFLSQQVERPSMVRTRWYSNLLMTASEQTEALSHVREFGDYIDSGGFQNLLERLAETESLTRGAPPASASFVKCLPTVTITKDHDKTDCVVCKESFAVGTITNQLPCLHVYHPSCILPWLSVRNTCPLCRYELPTDDKDYEERKRRGAYRYERFRTNRRMNTDVHRVSPNEARQVSEGEDGREEEGSTGENSAGRVSPRNRWFFLVPLASIFGISLMLWLGSASSSSGRRYQMSDRSVSYRKETAGQRRWWSFV